MSVDQNNITSQIHSVLNTANAELKGFEFIVSIHEGAVSRNTLIRDIIEKYEARKELKALKYIAAKSPLRPFSPLLGITCLTEKELMGLSFRNKHIAVLSFNLSEIKQSSEVKTIVYRTISEALDLADHYKNQASKSNIAMPLMNTLKTLGRCKNSLKADIFTALILSFQGKQRAIEDLAEKRGLSALSVRTKFIPEEYPFAMAMEALNFAHEDLTHRPAKSQFLTTARKMTLDIMKAFEISQIHQWWNFVRPAQDMAWRGSSQEDILSCAVNTSDDPHVRALGMMMSELLGIEPETSLSRFSDYNAFANHEQNLRTHKNAIENLFEAIVDDAVQADDSRPLFDAANEQNLSLTDGKVTGWCAHALQSAGKAYDKARAKGLEAIEIVREEFSKHISDELWDSLREFSEEIVKKGRIKGIVSMDDAQKIAAQNPDFSKILDSIVMTLSDPGYLAKLEAANDAALETASPSLSTEFPPASTNLGPRIHNEAQLAQAPAAPSLGGKTQTKQRPDLRVIENDIPEDKTSSDD